MISNFEKFLPSYQKRLVNDPLALGWGAPPLDIYVHPDIQTQQIKVYKALHSRTTKNIPADTPKITQDLIEMQFMASFHRENNKNFESHARRLHSDITNLTEEERLSYDRGLRGGELPKGLIRVREALGMKSIVLAQLQHPYAKYINLLPPLRDAVNTGILENGGELEDVETPATYSILNTDIVLPNSNSSERRQAGFSMQRDRKIGRLSLDTFVIEQSHFVVRTDPASGFPQEFARKMNSVKIKDNPDWESDLMDAGSLEQLIPQLLQTNAYKIAIPLNTKSIAYSPLTEQLILTREAQHKHAQSATRQELEQKQRLRDMSLTSEDLEEQIDPLTDVVNTYARKSASVAQKSGFMLFRKSDKNKNL